MSVWPVDQIMAVVMSRQVKDGDFVSHGASVPLAAAALMLAKELNAPNIDFFYQGTLTPKQMDPAKIRLDINEVYNSAPAFMSQADIVNFELRGGADFQFLRPAQVDPLGNVNTSLIGTLDHPRLRFHGIAVPDAMGVVGRLCLYTTEHSPRVFVERLSLRSGLGHEENDEWRRRLRLPGKGPSTVVSPLAIMDFGGSGQRMRLRSLHPGTSLDEVVDGTGFELEIPSDVSETEPPSDQELEALLRLDPLETRKLEFADHREEVLQRLEESLAP